MVEIKSECCLTKEDEAQIINSLKISNKKVDLLINFGELSLKFNLKDLSINIWNILHV